MSAITADPAEIRRAWELLIASGDITGLRALDVSTPSYRRPHTESGYYDDPLALVRDAAKLTGVAKGVYIVPNAVDPALLARAVNRCRVTSDRDPSTADHNITARRWILVDLDSKRPADSASKLGRPWGCFSPTVTILVYNSQVVNHVGYPMTFNEATDALLADGVSLNEIADALGVSYATAKQARLAPDNAAHRRPPVGWEPKLIQLARDRRRSLGESLGGFADQLSREYKAAYDEKALGRRWKDRRDGKRWFVRTYTGAGGAKMIRFLPDFDSATEDDFHIENVVGKGEDAMHDGDLQALLDKAKAEKTPSETKAGPHTIEKIKEFMRSPLPDDQEEEREG